MVAEDGYLDMVKTIYVCGRVPRFPVSGFFFPGFRLPLGPLLCSMAKFLIKHKKGVREKSSECHNHKPQPFPDTKRTSSVKHMFH